MHRLESALQGRVGKGQEQAVGSPGRLLQKSRRKVMRPEVAAREKGTIPSLHGWLQGSTVLATHKEHGRTYDPAQGTRPKTT